MIIFTACLPGVEQSGVMFTMLEGKNLFFNYCISWTIRRTMIFSFGFLEKNNDECILILVIDWKKTGLVRTKISNHNLIYSS